MEQPPSSPRFVLRVTALLVALLGVVAGCSSSSSTNAADSATSGVANSSDVYSVGITSFTVVDQSRPTPANAAQPGKPDRTIPVRVWYPAVAPNADGAKDDDFASVVDPSPQFDAPPATGSGPFPLIVFSHGLGAVPALYGDLMASWASAGYVVAAPAFPLSKQDAPGGPDAGDVSNQPGDVAAVITEAIRLSGTAEGRALAGMVDGENVGVSGHSNGGITTAGIIGQSCCSDDRVDAAIIVAGTSQLFPGGNFDWSRTPPLLVVHGENDTLIPLDEGKRLFNNARTPKGLFTVLGGDHTSFVLRDSKAFSITAKATLDFWNGYLKADSAAIAALPNDQQEGVATMRFVSDPTQTATVEFSTPTMTSRSATVTPSTNLRNGQTVRVSWSGFLPGRVVNVVQCAEGGRGSSSACNLVTGKILQPNPTGSGSLELQIVVGQVGTGICDADNSNCVITVNDASLQDEDANIRIPITFAR